LAERLLTRQARIGVMGLGYAGLPMALEFARAGFSVTGVDIDAQRVQLVNDGSSPVSDVDSGELADLVQARRLRATTDFEPLRSLDCVLVCVPTPLSSDGQPDLTYIRSATRALAARLHPAMLVILQSTCAPGTTRTLLQPLLQEASGLRVGEEIFLAFAPERIDPGNQRFNVHNTPKLVGGLTPTCTQLASLLYEPIVELVVPMSSPEAAEMTKLLENAFRFVNISFINEMALLCDRLGISIWEAIAAASTKPFAYMPHYPGPGAGGHCIPIVPFFLEAVAREHGMQGVMIEAAGRINAEMPRFVIGKLERLLRRRGKTLAGARVLVLGAAYKARTNDVRESPFFPVLKLLREAETEVAYYDPYVSSVYCDGAFLVSLNSAEVADQRFDCAVLITDQGGVDYAQLARRVDVLLDTRGCLSHVTAPAVALL
jgi:UDP-N-acetyl-D-glucosamine dehydrogenase